LMNWVLQVYVEHLLWKDADTCCTSTGCVYTGGLGVLQWRRFSSWELLVIWALILSLWHGTDTSPVRSLSREKLFLGHDLWVWVYWTERLPKNFSSFSLWLDFPPGHAFQKKPQPLAFDGRRREGAVIGCHSELMACSVMVQLWVIHLWIRPCILHVCLSLWLWICV
jgi:hypothetical protein